MLVHAIISAHLGASAACQPAMFWALCVLRQAVIAAHNNCCLLQANIENTVDMDELRFLLTGGISAGEIPANPLPWLADKLWAEMYRLSHFLAFTGLAEQVQKDQVSVKCLVHQTASGPGGVDTRPRHWLAILLRLCNDFADSINWLLGAYMCLGNVIGNMDHHTLVQHTKHVACLQLHIAQAGHTSWPCSQVSPFPASHMLLILLFPLLALQLVTSLLVRLKMPCSIAVLPEYANLDSTTAV